MADPTDKELIDLYFDTPDIVVSLNLELGFSGKVSVDWEKRIVSARGTKSGRVWNLDEMIKDLRAGWRG